MVQRKTLGAPEPDEIKTLRLDSGFTQAQVALMLDVREYTVQRWESGLTSMPGAAWNYFKLRVLPKIEQDWVNRYGLGLHAQNNGWLRAEFDRIDSDLIKGVIFAALYRRQKKFSNADRVWFDSTVRMRMRLQWIVQSDYEPDRAALLMHLANADPIVRGFALGCLIKMEVDDVQANEV